MRKILKCLNVKRYHISALVLLFAISAVVSGCEPLRKKFTRKKKKSQLSDAFIPVLDPIVYPDKMVSPQDIYRHHFALWQVWQKEILTAIHEDASDKRVSYLLSQLLLQFEEMQKVVTTKKREQLLKHTGTLNKIADQYREPSPLRNKVGIQSKIERMGKDMRLNFRLKNMEGHLALGATQP